MLLLDRIRHIPDGRQVLQGMYVSVHVHVQTIFPIQRDGVVTGILATGPPS